MPMGAMLCAAVLVIFMVARRKKQRDMEADQS